jgi:sialidase-1
MKITSSTICFIFFCLTLASLQAEEVATIRKLEDIVIYKNDQFHSAFPSIVRRPNGELLVAFRRAPDWRSLGAKGYTHTDPNSYLVLTRSKDDGRTWSEPRIFSAHPWGGSQDPCMVQLSDKSLLCASYAWARVPTNVLPQLKQPILQHADFAFLGGYLLRSKDGGVSWSDPIIPPPCQDEPGLDIFGKPVPAFNRGAMCEGKDGRLFWVVASNNSLKPRRTSTHLMISEDKGTTWKYSCVVADDPKVTFNETSIYETPTGDLVAFLRTADFDDHGCIARSTDHGKSFHKWQDMGFQGHPFYAMRLPDKSVLLVYGYRHAPFGIRARVLDAECTNFATTKEIVLRDDGGESRPGSVDLGYPWATMISKKKALVVYYMNINDGTRHIAGTMLALE